MKILSIETSCDETAVSLLEIDGRSAEVLGNALISQAKIHEQYGGVFPNVAKREHQRNLIPMLAKALEEAGYANKSSNEIDIEKAAEILEREPELLGHFKEFIPTVAKPPVDRIAVTRGPGLEPTLWVGINFARALGAVWNIPVIPCNHMEGHVLVSLLEKEAGGSFAIKEPEFPALALLISGGHTELVLMNSIGDYKVVGETRDDAVGECFDKIARTLGLPYPGGPEISRLAERARKEDIRAPEPLPRPMKNSPDLDFSFSGLKTAVLYLVKRLGAPDEDAIAGIARETEDAITDVLISKAERAIVEYGIRTLIIGGGVIANTYIRAEFEKLARKLGIEFLRPEVSHSTDNALMIAIAGYFNKEKAVSADAPIEAEGGLRIG